MTNLPQKDPTARMMAELEDALAVLVNQVEWSVQVPGSPSINREKEDQAKAEAKAAILAAFAAYIKAMKPEKIDHTKPENHESGCEVLFIEDDEGRPCTCGVSGFNNGLDAMEATLLAGLEQK